MAKTIKEIIIMLLICLITMLILAVAFYPYIPNRKEVPEITIYTASEEIQDLLADNIDKKSDDDNVILTYEVTAKDLNNYQSTNDYIPGKTNPFAAYSTSVTGEAETVDGTNSEDNQSSNTNSLGTSTPSVYSQNTGTK